MQIDVITAIVGVICTILGFILSLARFSRNRDKDVIAEAKREATINVKLDNISTGVQSLHTDIKTEQKARAELAERVTRVEESARQAHKRIDDIEKVN